MKARQYLWVSRVLHCCLQHCKPDIWCLKLAIKKVIFSEGIAQVYKFWCSMFISQISLAVNLYDHQSESSLRILSMYKNLCQPLWLQQQENHIGLELSIIQKRQAFMQISRANYRCEKQSRRELKYSHPQLSLIFIHKPCDWQILVDLCFSTKSKSLKIFSFPRKI